MTKLWVGVAMGVLAASSWSFAEEPNTGDCSQHFETVEVPANGKVVKTDEALELRLYHRVVAEGTVERPATGSADAEFAYGRKIVLDRCGPESTASDLGLALDERGGEASTKHTHWASAMNPKHVYETIVTGRDKRLSMRFLDCRGSDNKGKLKVTIYKCTEREPIR